MGSEKRESEERLKKEGKEKREKKNEAEEDRQTIGKREQKNIEK